ncbi:collagen alpha-2(I) chain-like [Eptesicus fuscus]|uniref:collagen alpha-2(I) chain-like n=1 Tax=Eptesicus fuscus TaxID=29078 RepID=UPI002404243A|nr:collagen alpha-2(I) chain-like [Eptesicus fuscus]
MASQLLCPRRHLGSPVGRPYGGGSSSHTCLCVPGAAAAPDPLPGGGPVSPRSQPDGRAHVPPHPQRGGPGDWGSLRRPRAPARRDRPFLHPPVPAGQQRCTGAAQAGALAGRERSPAAQHAQRRLPAPSRRVGFVGSAWPPGVGGPGPGARGRAGVEHAGPHQRGCLADRLRSPGLETRKPLLRSGTNLNTEVERPQRKPADLGGARMGENPRELAGALGDLRPASLSPPAPSRGLRDTGQGACFVSNWLELCFSVLHHRQHPDKDASLEPCSSLKSELRQPHLMKRRLIS